MLINNHRLLPEAARKAYAITVIKSHAREEVLLYSSTFVSTYFPPTRLLACSSALTEMAQAIYTSHTMSADEPVNILSWIFHV
jgi:hypothetical protein